MEQQSAVLATIERQCYLLNTEVWEINWNILRWRFKWTGFQNVLQFALHLSHIVKLEIKI
jgi:hypothetical protein